MKNNKKLNTLLIGEGKKRSNSEFSQLLVGKIKDKDRDGFITGFSKGVDDCKPNDPKRDGFWSSVSSAISSAASAVSSAVSSTASAIGGAVSSAVSSVTGKTSTPQQGTIFAKPGETFSNVPPGVSVSTPTGSVTSQIPSGNIQKELAKKNTSGSGGNVNPSAIYSQPSANTLSRQEFAKSTTSPQERAIQQYKQNVQNSYNKLKNFYINTEKKTSNKIPTLLEIKEKQLAVTSKITGKTVEQLKNEEIASIQKEGDYPMQIVGGVGKGFYSGIKEKPLQTAATGALFFTLPGALSGTAAVITKLPGGVKVIKVVEKTTPTVSKVLIGLYGFSVAKRVVTSPKPSEKIGEITSTEVFPMIIGGYFGAKYTPKISDFFRTYNRKEIPTEELVIKDVLTGKTNFVESKSYGYKGKFGLQKQKYDVFIFEKTGYGYHSTPQQFWGKKPIEIKKGTSEFEGLYIAPSPSVYFLKTQPETIKLYGGSFFSPYTKPAVAKIRSEKYDIKPAVQIKRNKFIFAGELEPNVAYVSGIKPEIEAIFPYKEGTTLQRVAKDLFFRFGGRRVPIDTFNVKGQRVNSIKNNEINIKDFGEQSYKYSYAEKPISYAVTPGSLLIGAVQSLKYYVNNYKSDLKVSELGSKGVPSKKNYNPISSITNKYLIPKGTGINQPPKTSSAGNFTYPMENPVPIISKPKMGYLGGKKKKSYLLEGSDEQKRKYKEQPYNAYAYIDATKGSKAKWQQLNEKPMNQESALSTMARFVDQSNLSAKGKITRAKTIIKNDKKWTQVVDTGDDYFERNKYKFREYKQRKGRKIPTAGIFIERTAYRLDSIQEKRNIQKAKQGSIFIGQFNAPNFGYPKNKTKNKGFLRNRRFRL